MTSFPDSQMFNLKQNFLLSHTMHAWSQKTSSESIIIIPIINSFYLKRDHGQY